MPKSNSRSCILAANLSYLSISLALVQARELIIWAPSSSHKSRLNKEQHACFSFCFCICLCLSSFGKLPAVTCVLCDDVKFAFVGKLCCNRLEPRKQQQRQATAQSKNNITMRRPMLSLFCLASVSAPHLSSKPLRRLGRFLNCYWCCCCWCWCCFFGEKLESLLVQLLCHLSNTNIQGNLEEKDTTRSGCCCCTAADPLCVSPPVFMSDR